MSTLVIRFSSLGDVVLCAGVTAALAPVVFATSARYATLAARFPGVQAVAALPEGGGVADLLAALPPVRRVVDLHGSLRSRVLCARLGLPTTRISRHRALRWLRVAAKVRTPMPGVLARYAACAGVQPGALPWIPLPQIDRAGVLGVAPGAAHATKRWPARRWRALMEAWAGPVRLFGSAGEGAALRALAAGLDAEVVAEDGFDATLAGLAGCRRVVGADSGLTHLARACGLPTLVVLGPTTPADGFWPDAPSVGRELPCRPCSAFGGPRCPIGDHACLEGLEVEPVLAALRALGAP